MTPVVKFESPEAMSIVKQAIQEKYHLAETEMNEFFCDAIPIGLGEEDGMLYRMQFHTHYQMSQEMKYGAVINLGTGKVEAVYSYNPEQWPKKLQILAFGAEMESKHGWYIHWDPENKVKLTGMLREIQMLPDHEYWTWKNPTEGQMNAFVAEAFGIPGYPSTVNEAVMVHALLGDPETWDMETQCLTNYLWEKYHIHSDYTAELFEKGTEEIDQETAAQKVISAVCKAWNMPEGSLNDWDCTVQLVQAPATLEHESMACYRVFLTRPDSELGQDTFGRRDNFNYRIQLDGTIMDSTMVSEWYSPEEDVLRWSKTDK